MSYRTVVGDGSGEYVEKRSKFIANAYHVESEEETLAIIEETRKKYWDARHCVYAYVIRNNNIARFSDDGEPSKSAGAPIMDILSREGLYDCLITVVRYFGGVLLGVGGLVRAYSVSAKSAIEDAGTVLMEPCSVFGVTVSYSDWGKLQNIVRTNNAQITKSEFSENVYAEITVKSELSEKLRADINEIFNASLELSLICEEYRGVNCGL